MLSTVVNFLSVYVMSKLLKKLFFVVKCIKWVLSRFKDIKLALNHSCICWRILLTSSLKLIGSGFEIIKLVSSANRTILLFLFIECGKSFIYKRKSMQFPWLASRTGVKKKIYLRPCNGGLRCSPHDEGQWIGRRELRFVITETAVALITFHIKTITNCLNPDLPNPILTQAHYLHFLGSWTKHTWNNWGLPNLSSNCNRDGALTTLPSFWKCQLVPSITSTNLLLATFSVSLHIHPMHIDQFF